MGEIIEQKIFPFAVKRINPDYPSVTERYFSAKFYIPKSNQIPHEHPASDQCVLIHSNGICIITLGPNHPVVKGQKQIDKVEFIQQTVDNSVSGKFKKGGIKLKPNTILCKILCKDGSIHTIVSCLKSSLIEINKKLINFPQLVVSDTWSKGYIAVVKQLYEEENEKFLLNYDQYIKLKDQTV